MKRCPQCKREYGDDTLIFCLQDGVSLVAIVPDEPPTARLPDPSRASQVETRLQINPDKKRITTAIVIGLGVLVAVAIGLYFLLRDREPRRIDTIAVMPFVNESGNPDLEYLSDGLTDTLIGSLSKVPGLNVKSRSSAFRYKGREREVRAIGRELGVPAVLNGRVVQRGDDLTLFLELVDTDTENSLWQNTYNRKLSGLIELQSEIARDVSSKLGAHLSKVQETRISRGYSVNPEAYQLYMRGRFHTLRVSSPELLKAIPYMEQAIKLDPNYALAYVGLADAYRGLPLAGERDPEEFFPKAKAAVQKALEIDGELAEAHAILGWLIYWYDWDWELAERHGRKALELDPNSGDGYMALAHILSSTGRHDEAVAIARRGRDVEPVNLRTATLEGMFLTFAGRHDEALERFEKVLELDPNYWFAYTFKASALIDLGRLPEAIAVGEKGRMLNPAHTRNLAFIAYGYAKSGDVQKAKALLEDVKNKRVGESDFVSPFNIAIMHLGLGDRAEAIRWLERGVVERDPRMVFVFAERKFAELRGEPDFERLLKRMRFIK